MGWRSNPNANPYSNPNLNPNTNPKFLILILTLNNSLTITPLKVKQVAP